MRKRVPAHDKGGAHLVVRDQLRWHQKATRHTTGGVTCQGQSERLKPDPRRRVQASQVAIDWLAETHAQSGPKRWPGSVEQGLHAEGVGTARPSGVGSRPMPFAQTLTIEQTQRKKRRESRNERDEAQVALLHNTLEKAAAGQAGSKFCLCGLRTTWANCRGEHGGSHQAGQPRR